MPINPLELQTNFSQLNQVGKQISSIKENENVKESQINNAIQKNSEKEAEDIPETKDAEELYKLKEESEKKKKKKKEEEDKKVKEESEEEVVDENKLPGKDAENPNIGRNIDIIG